MSVTITARQLRAKGACADQLALFRERFGASVTFDTLEALEAACVANPDFDYSWAAGALFSEPIWEEYERQRAPILAEYERQRAPIWAEYERQRAPILAEYERQHEPIRTEYARQRAPIWAEYERQRAPIWAEYERQHEPIWAEYARQRATLWATLFWKHARCGTRQARRYRGRDYLKGITVERCPQGGATIYIWGCDGTVCAAI